MQLFMPAAYQGQGQHVQVAYLGGLMVLFGIFGFQTPLVGLQKADVCVACAIQDATQDINMFWKISVFFLQVACRMNRKCERSMCCDGSTTVIKLTPSNSL